MTLGTFDQILRATENLGTVTGRLGSIQTIDRVSDGLLVRTRQADWDEYLNWHAIATYVLEPADALSPPLRPPSSGSML